MTQHKPIRLMKDEMVNVGDGRFGIREDLLDQPGDLAQDESEDLAPVHEQVLVAANIAAALRAFA